MRLARARVQKYRSIKDSGWFDIERLKTILVGPNEAGKTALLQALQQLNAPEDVPGFRPLQDYVRSEVNDITRKVVDPAHVTIVEGEFELEASDIDVVGEDYKNATYILTRTLNNESFHSINGGPTPLLFGTLRRDFIRLCAHIDSMHASLEDDATGKPSDKFNEVTESWDDDTEIDSKRGSVLSGWLDKVLPLVDENNPKEEARHQKLCAQLVEAGKQSDALETLAARVPVFVLFNNYFRVRPQLHLEHLAARIESGVLDDEQYDYGNKCLLKLLGFSARELSKLGKADDPDPSNGEAFQRYSDQLNTRDYQLNGASVRLTDEIRSIWVPNANRGEADKLTIKVDGQYLKVVVEDEHGVEVELDQRSEGLQWLVSFFVVFFAEAETDGEHENAILLLDEPGLSLHALKQREFRSTISRLSEQNQTIYTTHSPFLVGPDELDIVRVVEMVDRKTGTKVHTKISAQDPGALLPLQEALGYDLAQSLFTHTRNLILEGLTDFWYVESISELLNNDGSTTLNDRIALIPAAGAGKVVYFATILHANKLKVAALLDSDNAGDSAAQQDTLVSTLGNKNILRTKDVYKGKVAKPEVEDLLRETLVQVANAEFGKDVSAIANAQPSRGIVDIFNSEIPKFSKYRLAKRFVQWSRDNNASDLASDEKEQWSKLIGTINSALK